VTRAAVLLLALFVILAAAPGTARAQREAPAALVAAARAVSREISGIRGLPWKEPVAFQVSDRATIQSYAEAALAREMSPAEWDAYGELLAFTGLVPRDLDLQELVADLYAEQIAGYYDPHLQTFYLADWLPPLLQRAVVAHEATHALQDQHFDLERWMGEVPSTEDGALARGAVVEGEAMAVMLAYLLAPTGMTVDQVPDVGSLMQGPGGDMAGTFPSFANAPPALQRILLFPYVEGSRFVIEGLRQDGWEALDRLYADPPASTEQILHPARYWETRDPPTSLEIPRGDPGMERVIAGSWGELGVQLILAGGISDSLAGGPARGWDGDRFALYRGEGGAHRFAWSSAWDTPRDAEEFALAYAQALARRFPGPARIETGTGRYSFQAPGRSVAIRWSGRRVEVRENG
jgi:hypothetical protein